MGIRILSLPRQAPFALTDRIVYEKAKTQFDSTVERFAAGMKNFRPCHY